MGISTTYSQGIPWFKLTRGDLMAHTSLAVPPEQSVVSVKNAVLRCATAGASRSMCPSLLKSLGVTSQLLYLTGTSSAEHSLVMGRRESVSLAVLSGCNKMFAPSASCPDNRHWQRLVTTGYAALTASHRLACTCNKPQHSLCRRHGLQHSRLVSNPMDNHLLEHCICPPYRSRPMTLMPCP